MQSETADVLYERFKGNIKFDNKNKRYYIHFSYNGKPTYASRVGWTKSKKQLALDHLLALCNQLTGEEVSREVTSKKIKTIAEIIPQFFEFESLEKSPGTIITSKRIFKNHIIPYIGNIEIRLLKRSDLQDALTKMKNKKFSKDGELHYYSDDYLLKIYTHLNTLIQFLLFEELINKDLMWRMPKPKNSFVVERTIRNKVTYTDVIKVVDSLSVPGYKVALMIAVWNIIRPGEIFGLNFESDCGDFLEIKQSWNNETKTMGPPKGGKSRMSPISPQLRKVIDEYYIFLDSTGVKHSPQSPLIGVTKRQPKTTIDRHIKEAIKTCGVPHFSWYDVRRSVITELLEIGNDPYKVAKNAGHQKTQTTDTYAIVNRDDQKSITQSLVLNRTKE